MILMTMGYVSPAVELLTRGHGITPVRGFHQPTCPLLYRLALILASSLYVWRYEGGQPQGLHWIQTRCVVLALKVLQVILLRVWFIQGMVCRSSEGLCCFNPSKGTNLLILIILAGDIEMTPGPRLQCHLCKKMLQGS